MADTIEVLVDGGAATPGNPLGPALGPLGVNVVAIVTEINKQTAAMKGMKVPVKIVIQADKSFAVSVGTPPTSALILAEAKLPKGSGAPKSTKVGNLTMAQVVKITQVKAADLMGRTTRDRAREVVGTCVSMGVTVDGQDARQVQTLIKEGKYDAALREGAH
jgi:large subunit ribosomal protein L11